MSDDNVLFLGAIVISTVMSIAIYVIDGDVTLFQIVVLWCLNAIGLKLYDNG